MAIHVLILNFEGRDLLAECLPSIVEAGRRSRHRCRVAVVDNDSRDDSVSWLARQWPQVEVFRSANRGLCSFNAVVAGLEGSVALLLNNDIKLDPEAIDPLVEPLVEPAGVGQPCCFMTAPRCRLFDGTTHEGLKTAVRWRWGLVEATGRFGGHEEVADLPDLTASAGAAMAVDCRIFSELGGFDPLFLPGRIEDLDFALRGYLAGYQARYIPQAMVYHRGMASFGPAFGETGNDFLALRNTLLFQWKNLRHPRHLARQAVGWPLRAGLDLLRAPWVGKQRRWGFLRAFLAARKRWRQHRRPPRRGPFHLLRERRYFERFHPRRFRQGAEQQPTGAPFHLVRSAEMPQPPAQDRVVAGLPTEPLALDRRSPAAVGDLRSGSGGVGRPAPNGDGPTPNGERPAPNGDVEVPR